MTSRVSLFAIAFMVTAFVALNWLVDQPWAPLGTFIADAVLGVCGLTYARQTNAAALPVFIFLLRADRDQAKRPYFAIVALYGLSIFIGVIGAISYFLEPSLYAN